MGGRELSAALTAQREQIKVLYMSGYTETRCFFIICSKCTCLSCRSRSLRKWLPGKSEIFWTVVKVDVSLQLGRPPDHRALQPTHDPAQRTQMTLYGFRT